MLNLLMKLEPSCVDRLLEGGCEGSSLCAYLTCWGIDGAGVLVGILAVLILLFLVVYLFADLAYSPGGTIKRILPGLLLAGLAAVIYFVFSDGTIPDTLTKVTSDFGVTSGVMKFINAGFLMTAILIGIAFVSWVLLELFNLVK